MPLLNILIITFPWRPFSLIQLQYYLRLNIDIVTIVLHFLIRNKPMIKNRQRITVMILMLCSQLPAQDQSQSQAATNLQARVTPLPKGTRVLNDLEYTKIGDVPVGLDLYLPAGDQRPKPVIVWIHGGGWYKGSKKPLLAGAFVERGYAVASIDYRLSDLAVFPAQIHDCKAAIRWLRANAREYNLDAEHIGAWGGSAGGHLAALLGTSGGVKELEGDGGNPEYSSRVQAVCEWYGPSDLPGYATASQPARNIVEKLVGGPAAEKKDLLVAASPVTYVSKDSPPFLIAHGDADTLVPLSESKKLVAALKSAGVQVTFDIIPGEKHGFRNPSEPIQKALIFFDKHLKPEPEK
jgi:acetyl esterase/lipase